MLRIKLARYLVTRYIVNVYKNPQYLSNDGKYCERNHLVSKCMESIDELIKGLKVGNL